MATEGGQTAIRKKLQSARQQATPVAARLGAVWGEAVPKVTEDVLGLEAMVGRVGVTVRSLTRTLEDVPETSLMVRLERPDGEGFGLAIAEATLLAAIIEAQTGGRVRKGPVPERRPTATDAMMLADLLDPWLVAADAGLLDHPGFEDVTGYRTGGYLVDARTVLMSLPEGDYKLAEIALDFQTGTRVGGLKLLFPPCDAPQGIEEEEKSLGEALSDAVMDAPARIEAVLCTTKRSLGQITAFQPGDVLKVPLSSLMAVQLRSPDGRRLSSARLGQLNGQRAVRVQLAAPAGQGVEAQPDGSPGEFAAGLPDMPDLPDLPDLPGPPDASEAASLPDLPPPPPPPMEGLSQPDGALPALPDLPELPDQPDLPPLPE